MIAIRILFFSLFWANCVHAQKHISACEQIDSVYLKKPYTFFNYSADKFTNTLTIRTPFLNNEFQQTMSKRKVSPIRFTKILTLKSNTYYLHLNSYSSIPLIDAKGVYLILSDGSRMSWENEKVDCDVNPNNEGIGKDYTLTAFVKLTPQQVTRLSSNIITDFKLYIVIEELDAMGIFYMCYLQKLMKEKLTE